MLRFHGAWRPVSTGEDTLENQSSDGVPADVLFGGWAGLIFVAIVIHFGIILPARRKQAASGKEPGVATEEDPEFYEVLAGHYSAASADAVTMFMTSNKSSSRQWHGIVQSSLLSPSSALPHMTIAIPGIVHEASWPGAESYFWCHTMDSQIVANSVLIPAAPWKGSFSLDSHNSSQRDQHLRFRLTFQETVNDAKRSETLNCHRVQYGFCQFEDLTRADIEIAKVSDANSFLNSFLPSLPGNKVPLPQTVGNALQGMVRSRLIDVDFSTPYPGPSALSAVAFGAWTKGPEKKTGLSVHLWIVNQSSVALKQFSLQIDTALVGISVKTEVFPGVVSGSTSFDGASTFAVAELPDMKGVLVVMYLTEEQPGSLGVDSEQTLGGHLSWADTSTTTSTSFEIPLNQLFSI